MQLDGYIRVSRVGGRTGERFISPDVQREQIESWARMRGHEISEWHIDLDQSGGKRDRPGLLAALERVEAKLTGGMVVAKLDRLARSLPVALDTIDRIDRADGMLVAVQDNVDPSTAIGRATRDILLVIAALYREQAREQFAIADERAIRRGASVASTVATGYEKSDNGVLRPDPVWAPVIRRVFEQRAAGTPWADLARFMNAEGVPTKHAGGGERGRGQWTGSTVSRLVSSRVYLGEAFYGEYRNPDAHEPLVPVELWHAAQAARGVAPTGRTKLGEEPPLLGGLVRCARCGYGMYRAVSKGRDSTGNRSVEYASYRCRGNASGGKCPQRASSPADALEQLVVDEYLAHVGRLASRASVDTPALSDALDELHMAEEALSTFRDDPRIIAALGADGFAAGLTARGARVRECEEAVALARMPAAGMPDITALRGMWPDLDRGSRRRLLAAAIDCVVVDGQRTVDPGDLRICWAGLGPTGLPSRGGHGAVARRIDLDGLPPDTRVTLGQ